MDKYIFAIFAVYGPNDNDKTFFTNIAKFVTDLGDVPVIMGGGIGMPPILNYLLSPILILLICNPLQALSGQGG
jgi:hypothetical protein